METMTEPKPLGALDRIIGVITEPEKTFTDIAARPSWGLPMMLALLAMIAVGILMKDVIQKESAEKTRISIMENKNIPDGDKQRIIDQSIEMMKKFWVVGFAVGMVVIVIAYFISALILRLGGSAVLKSAATFTQVLAIFSWSGIVDLLGALIKLPIMYINQSMRVDTGLGILIGEELGHTTTYLIMSKFDIFTIWMLIVMSIGIAVVFKAPKSKSMILVFGLWLVWVLAQWGMALMGMRVGG
ncbi:YIP1 family protein [bacterium]|nr:YIP1 family protein [bacterium]NUN45631.1 YIP1 family protein [bacterium]